MRSIIGLQTPLAGNHRVTASHRCSTEIEAVESRKRSGRAVPGRRAMFSTLTGRRERAGSLARVLPRHRQALLDEIAAYKIVMTGLRPPLPAPKYPAELSRAA
jgi:phospholipid/cholesterol/gamma-HCH transport system ATP-binding protein